MSDARTIVDLDGVHVETDGGVAEILRFRHPAGASPRETLGRIAAALDEAMAQESDGDPLAPTGEDPDRDAVMAFVAERLELASSVAVPDRPAAWIGRADGRDSTGRVHVSVDGAVVALLGVPPDVLADTRAAAGAILEAFNLARARQADDARAQAELLGVGQDVDGLAQVSWAELHESVRRIRALR